MYDLTPPSELTPSILREAATRALGEDLGPADITGLATVAEDRECSATIVTREACVLAGLPVARQVFVESALNVEMESLAEDGDRLQPGDKILEVRGTARDILKAERVALNFLQQLSAVATKTRRFVDAVAGSGVRILDTRKTIPGLRVLQKYAVRCGGGHNHRMGLYDAFMIKDNHLMLMGEPGNWQKAVQTARELNPDAMLEVEADTVEQVRIFAQLDVDRILLDNMTICEMVESVMLVADAAETEASGNMSLERVVDVASTGVDFISVGELTHSIQSLDMSLEMQG